MKAYLESSTTNIYCLNRKNVLHYVKPKHVVLIVM